MNLTDQTWLWAIPALPLAGSALCGILHYLTIKARMPKRAHGAHGHDDHGHDAHGHGHAAHADHAASDHGAGDHAHGGDHGHGHAKVEPGLSAFAPWIAVLAMAGAFALAIKGFLGLQGETHALESPAWDWIDTGTFRIDLAIVLDRLSSVMTLVITGVGTLIHIYAAGYMKGDKHYAKFFAYLNLFVFAMLMLVLSSNLLGLFVGWEGVGLCSYFLIGFWYEKGWPAEAGQKAFVMNRIGDASFLIGSFLLVKLFGTLDLSDIVAGVSGLLGDPEKKYELLLAGLFLFGGACGKSAQLPLFTWLPDAMAGPTPVSALIHAATMVTAGIYLTVRLNPVYAASPDLLFFIGAVGAVTALIAGSTALVQRDIKRVLAYSTVSQLGYMFLGLGTGAWAAAIFHLVTHAFFKALLFLGAGSVIHGMHEEQDMHKMGGLKKHMPATYFTFLAGAAALSGLPLLSGYFSKDEILAHTFAHGGAYRILWGIGIATAAMTAFYTWRMVALTFFGKERFDPHHVHPHESPSVMTVPLMVLAVLSVFGGLLGLPPVLGSTHALEHWLEPVTAAGNALLAEHGTHALDHGTEWMLLGLGAVIALVFMGLGIRAYVGGTARDEKVASSAPGLARFLQGAWGIDAAYTAYVVRPMQLLFFVVAIVIDQFTIDGMVNGAGAVARTCGDRVRRMTSGNIATYGLWMGAAAALIAFLFLKRIG
ncbi:MAG: NADH-quinone oxidoreductase subunit L [Planctomycetes bacterium]|nr:NADH-quinone oxidoreductase subunit L [Planctomycetota bacterium]